MSERAALEARWLDLTRRILPGLAGARGWPVRSDHCFQRILLDAVCGGRWYDHVPERPAYRHLDDARLVEAVALAERVERAAVDLHALNAQSLRWRGKA
jgi:hypothetical protein